MFPEFMEKTRSTRKAYGSGIQVLLSMACVVLLVAGLKAASSLFIPIMLGLFLAMLSMPILNWLDRRGLPRPLAVLMTILVDLLILGGIVFLTSGVIGNFTENSVEYTEKLRNQAAEFSRTMDQKIAQLEQLWSESGENGQKPESAPVDNSSPAPETIVVPEVSPPAEGEVLEEDGPPQLVPSITFSKLFDL